jgi:hypothetical protein
MVVVVVVALLEGVLYQETSHGGGGGLLEGVLHQETSHGGGGGLLVGVQLPKMGVATKLDKTNHLRNAIILFFNYRVYIPSQKSR